MIRPSNGKRRIGRTLSTPGFLSPVTLKSQRSLDRLLSQDAWSDLDKPGLSDGVDTAVPGENEAEWDDQIQDSVEHPASMPGPPVESERPSQRADPLTFHSSHASRYRTLGVRFKQAIERVVRQMGAANAVLRVGYFVVAALVVVLAAYYFQWLSLIPYVSRVG